eukprot:6090535-Pleurochrysis_carterae.AAC.1
MRSGSAFRTICLMQSKCLLVTVAAQRRLHARLELCKFFDLLIAGPFASGSRVACSMQARCLLPLNGITHSQN